VTSLVWILIGVAIVAGVLVAARRRRVPGEPSSGDASWYPAVWDNDDDDKPDRHRDGR
jgi:hypothetical protein